MSSSQEKRLQNYQVLLQWFALLLMVILALNPSVILSTEHFIGAVTRDTYDHIALIDLWQVEVQNWNFPTGGSVLAPDFFGMVLARPFMFLGRGIAYDVAIVLQVWLNCLAGWFLGRRLGSAWVGAIALGFSPYLLGQINSGEMETLSVWPLVFTVLAASEGKWRRAGIWGAITAIGSWYYGAYAAVLLAVIIGKEVWNREFSALKGLAWMGGLIAIPALYYADVLGRSDQMFRGPTMETYVTEQPRALAGFSSDPLGWISEPALDSNHVDSLGWVFLLFAVLGFRDSSKKERLFWGTVVCLGLALSLGPTLHISRVVVWEWMPYDLLVLLPPLDLMRLPHRWLVVAMIGLTALIAKGGKQLPLLASCVLLGESLWFMVPQIHSTEIQMPEVIEYFDGAVLQLPARTMQDDLRGPYLVMQRYHGQKIPYSLLMQAWSVEMAEEPLVIAVTSMDSSDPISTRPVEARQFRQEDFAMAVAAWNGQGLEGARERLKAKGFTQVCLHLNFLPRQDVADVKSLMLKELGEPDQRTAEALLWQL